MLHWSVLCSVTIVLTIAYEYNFNYDRVELAYYEKSLVKDVYFLFRKYNRTNFCLNVSFDLLQDLDGNDIEFTTTTYQKLNNQYSKMGLSFRFNVCKYWRNDIFGTTSELAKYGNLEGCNITKGHYYLSNYMPSKERLPQRGPLGNYMLEITVIWNSKTTLLKIQWYLVSTLQLKGRNVFP